MSTASILAVVAIGISALTLVWTIFWSVFTHRRATRARLLVTTAFSIPVYDANQLGQAAIGVTATNTGQTAVSVTGVLIQTKGEEDTIVPMEWVVQTPAPLPVVLEPGQHWNGLVDSQTIIRALTRRWGQRKEWEIRAVVRDPAGNSYRPKKWMTLDIGAVGVFADGIAR